MQDDTEQKLIVPPVRSGLQASISYFLDTEKISALRGNLQIIHPKKKTGRLTAGRTMKAAKSFHFNQAEIMGNHGGFPQHDGSRTVFFG